MLMKAQVDRPKRSQANLTAAIPSKSPMSKNSSAEPPSNLGPTCCEASTPLAVKPMVRQIPPASSEASVAETSSERERRRSVYHSGKRQHAEHSSAMIESGNLAVSGVRAIHFQRRPKDSMAARRINI